MVFHYLLLFVGFCFFEVTKLLPSNEKHRLHLHAKYVNADGVFVEFLFDTMLLYLPNNYLSLLVINANIE